MIGQRIGSYTIVEKLGEGGMGVVYRATDSRLHRDVALKFIPEALAKDPQIMGRFEREAQVLASLNHPNIASIYGLEENAGQRALVMELASGDELSARIARGKLPLEEALRIALAIAEALEAAHDKGIIHRDLKPANIKLGDAADSGGGRLKILDFGLAKALQGDLAGASRVDLTHSPTLSVAATQAGMILGTASYMSPEQARALPADRRADIWSFGVILYEMLAGRRAFLGDTVADTIAKVIEREPDLSALPATTPLPIKSLIERCLVKNPRNRLQSIGDARLVLQETLQSSTSELSMGVPAPIEPVRERSGVSRRLALAAWAVITAGALVWAVVATLGRTPRQAGGPTEMRVQIALGQEGFDTGLGSAVAFSPDGRRIAYIEGDSERQTLYVRALDELESLQLTGKEGTAAIELPYHPFFSPDGKWVGFVTTSELYKVQVNGGTPIKICEVERSRGATWLPDDSIVIASAHAGGLARVRANGGEPAPLTELDTSRREGSHRWPQALPGGDHILFTSHTASGNFDNAALEVVSLESGERKVVYQGGSYGRYAASGHLVFANGGTLFAVRFDPERHEVVGSPVPVLQDLAVNPSEGAAQFDFSSAGQLVYVTAGETDVFPIVWVDRAGRTEALWAEEGVYANPRLSPDGRRLSLTVLRDNNWDVWVHDLERGVPTRLTFGASVDSEQIWSPDGETLVFSSDQDGPDRLYRKRADGSGEVEALTETTGKPQWAQAWSRDGRYIATTEGDTEYDLWYLDLETRQMKEVLATEFGDGYPDFSPDGRWIVYASNESGSFQVYVRPFPEGHGKWQVSEAGGGNPRWSRSGKEIFWRTNSGIAVAEVDISGGTFRAGKPKILFEGAFQGGALGMSVGGFLFADYDVSPDGQRFVMFPNLRGERGSHQHITLVTHWFDDLERLTEGGAR